MRTLVFHNADATPKTAGIRCDTASVKQIMAWYGAYFAGDRYTATLDGLIINMNHNGEPIGDLP